MDELISRQSALNTLRSQRNGFIMQSDCEKAIGIIVTQPTITENINQGQWEVVEGVVTPGGDPLLQCPYCKSQESRHLYGVENRIVWHYCPICGAKLSNE